ncbi:metallophosphoesterase [Fimbriimonas ginsengisoli Gsoil 348]|uniref:Metallophosphoesterase n=2 Tax=Fimbriimonas ginsengisoli TaxID=1005039 RepID=A0A068NQ78_FIMGI|nr:metallophosphoesterase [Fimbriimonas ginsengisoli Gsoil 348]
MDVQGLLDEDGIDRRGFLKCMAWAGTGMLFTVQGGILKSQPLMSLFGSDPEAEAAIRKATFSFVQISDSHIGFSKQANKDVVGTLQAAVERINLGPAPDLLLHTGDLSHLSKPEEFDTLDQVLKGVRTTDRFFVPGEHDVLEDGGKLFRERYGRQAKGEGWYSFDHKGVHFVALVNVLNLKAGGFGSLGEEQLSWLRDDVRNLRSSTPIVVFAHVPLWTVYPEWGWGTDDGGRALEILKRFGSVTVLNGHIHQTMQKVEGNVTFHTAMSTAFPQPKPGSAPSPGPMTVPAGELKGLLGVTTVQYRQGQSSLAIVDSSLAAAGQDQKVSIDNFSFSPATLTVERGTRVTWTNRDDIPHTVVDQKGGFKSKVLDTNDSYSHTFDRAGEVAYFCSIHPHMTGKVIVH